MYTVTYNIRHTWRRLRWVSEPGRLSVVRMGALGLRGGQRRREGGELDGEGALAAWAETGWCMRRESIEEVCRA